MAQRRGGDLNDAAAPVTGNVCLGVWVQTGRRTYRLKHPAWRFDPDGKLIGSQLLREEVTLAAGGNSLTASAAPGVFRPGGKKVGELPPGEVRGERITWIEGGRHSLAQSVPPAGHSGTSGFEPPPRLHRLRGRPKTLK
jgi:hypothetical protein